MIGFVVQGGLLTQVKFKDLGCCLGHGEGFGEGVGGCGYGERMVVVAAIVVAGVCQGCHDGGRRQLIRLAVII